MSQDGVNDKVLFIWNKWVNPTTVMALFGAIVWGIQLNFAVLNNTKELGQLEEAHKKVYELLQSQHQILARQTAILEQLEIRLSRHEERTK